VLVSGCLLYLLLAVVLASYSAVLGNIVNSDGDAPGLADDQGIAAVSVLLYWTSWNSSMNLFQRVCHL